MSEFITDTNFESRLRKAVSLAWAVFARKVGGGLIPVNKEASMQLQYAYVLKQLLPLTIQRHDESVDLELEVGVKTDSGNNNIDILVRGREKSAEINIAIEMKCYRTLAASGGTRGAHDIFMKDVYEDLQILEAYLSSNIASRGVALVMNDLERFVLPKVKNGKCWAYDISQGTQFTGCEIDVPIGGKPVSIQLIGSYKFDWRKFGEFWFLELEWS